MTSLATFTQRRATPTRSCGGGYVMLCYVAMYWLQQTVWWTRIGAQIFKTTTPMQNKRLFANEKINILLSWQKHRNQNNQVDKQQLEKKHLY